jgi:broad specificity phosphatase PhoE
VSLTTVWLARHGETEWAAQDIYNGRRDIPVNARGRSQAAQLARRLRTEPLAAVYCSSLRRCVETATIVATPHGLAPKPDPAFVEVDYGVWDGMPRSEIAAQYPDLYAAWFADPAGVLPPGGESGYHVLGRAVPALQQVVTAHAGQAVLIVAHKATNRLLLCHILGIPPRSYRARLGQLPCCLNKIEWYDGEPMVTLLNDVSFQTAPLDVTSWQQMAVSP